MSRQECVAFWLSNGNGIKLMVERAKLRPEDGAKRFGCAGDHKQGLTQQKKGLGWF